MELYESAAVPTKKEAAAAVGLTSVSLGMAMKSPVGQAYTSALSGQIHDKVVDLSATIERLSARALERVEYLMNYAGKEDVQLRASQDILDRNPVTSKTSRLTVDKLSLNGRDVEALIKAVTQGKGLKETFPDAAAGDFTPAIEPTE